MSDPSPEAIPDNSALKRLRKKMTIEVLFMWILRLLSEGDKYAYELREEVGKRFGFSPATVTSYAVLYKMAREGLVVAIDRSSLFPNRKYYSITPLGQQTLASSKKVIDHYRSLLELDSSPSES
ncbi:MAG: PadR family transcriptional regulator [Candidatus Heimdallarchaeota archaeon]|nr:PadR family transcriptional regulator [Candidatus Heimdallarchaeota archaeon]MCK5048431.1 PadR family transcriptional regulator [Candidatus Heimdallarchaeota archaeon]